MASSMMRCPRRTRAHGDGSPMGAVVRDPGQQHPGSAKPKHALVGAESTGGMACRRTS